MNFIVLARVLEDQGIQKGGFVTGPSADPRVLAWRFSPVSNEKPIPESEQLRVLVATDVLSEGQNLQDGAIIREIPPLIGNGQGVESGRTWNWASFEMGLPTRETQ
ncbi:hypothetical protein J5X98_18560 [Leptothermofonsia sichuanensis E412]|uniref:hypothetical protein n=1 Tax=Leptothermofonsia sichuanensis TaxID=2917832 RepID=UPI001CA73875|nr:hypothetical protein [Leptothermofonsia sichuanensis]QZZ23817.1 hypothetical protein J5X98_18560 [Leptothermofonsia sichuanensis E412]